MQLRRDGAEFLIFFAHFLMRSVFRNSAVLLSTLDRLYPRHAAFEFSDGWFCLLSVLSNILLWLCMEDKVDNSDKLDILQAIRKNS
jgi:hypothetical protein